MRDGEAAAHKITHAKSEIGFMAHHQIRKKAVLF